MDGVRQTYDVGGYASASQAMQERDGVLILRMGNNKYTGPDHVASIPLRNVRSYVATERR